MLYEGRNDERSGYVQKGYIAPYGEGYPAPGAPPGYGPPGYGVPPTEPPRRTGRVVAIVAAIVVVLLIAGLGIARLAGPKMLSHTAVEQTIEKQSKDSTQSYVALTNVQCNGGKDIKVTKDATFICTADNDQRVIVRITSNDADYTWTLSG